VREPEVESAVRAHLEHAGYALQIRTTATGPDIHGRRDGRTLVVEVKGDRPGHQSSPGTINVDVMTLLGQIVLRKGSGAANDYAVAIRPVHRRLISQAMPALRELDIRVLLVTDDGTVEEMRQ